ncbi:aerial mycelium formation regulatory protein [Streptomyces albus]|uniref:Aerial mycelium formation regulatory protein n=1 Tax=Streptomyces albus (strain ATCC 21838 / DSM 41398 / FERM P-419 / JCM 4703 / NBRC 107858) TaxID=1081613 RepID=A0A0B5EYK3_STRA4|nr:aerial mycelium formation regulatory protein [Streptomyces albus]AOU78766.1 aerial mycelium formation regulatory protein [Streptomyces albus]AYN34500.1 hypothetical protein DUI70_4001 [Streptomyces albus]
MSRPSTGWQAGAPILPATAPAPGRPRTAAQQPPVQRTGSTQPPAARQAREAAGGSGPLGALCLAELRALRQQAQHYEADLSYLRRLLQGRIDILGAELARRSGDGGGAGAGADRLSAQLAQILADKTARPRSSARHLTLGTPRSAEYRRLAGEMLAEVELSDLEARTDEELRAARRRLGRYEHVVSGRRQRVQRTADRCGAEITRRYREGEARVDDLLA